MFWAKDPGTSQPIKAEPHGVGICPMCEAPCVAKCGTLVLWHWAHRSWDDDKARPDCDSWHENESQWHYDWKARVPQHMREYVLRRQLIAPDQSISIGIHRADILNSRGTVIELQHSPISSSVIREREMFYHNMIWIFDAQEWRCNLQNPDTGSTRPKIVHDKHQFMWKWPRKGIWRCRSPVFFHFGGQTLFRPTRFSEVKPYLMEGEFTDFQTFLNLFFI